MFDNIWTSFNWLDVVLILVIIRIVFIGVVQGFVVEFFKISGMFFATVVSLHYYARMGKFFHESLDLPEWFTEIFSLIVLLSVMVLMFKVVREGWLLILKMEAKPGFSQWGGGILGCFRSFLICGLVIFSIYLTENQVLVKYADRSMVGSYLRDLPQKVYRAAFDGVLVKFFPDEEFNNKAFSTIEKDKEDKTD